ncbi:lipase [Paramyrothecium foliicola]|nr:lipase [Paramyrothecium foliicola]
MTHKTSTMIFKFFVGALASAAVAVGAATPRDKPAMHGLVDLGYAKHVPTSINTTSSGHKVSIYRNIRFANAPTGDLRFRWPDTKLKRMNGIQNGAGSRSCIASAPSYIPVPGVSGTTYGQEDCLFLDVYVPEGVRPGDKVPVLHYIHGGSYAFGSKEFMYNPLGLFDHMFRQDLGKFIIVANNYRLGLSGWTYAEGEKMDSNVGLFDSLAAIEWTSKHIGKFGGDKGRITASGSSAGAGIVHYLLTLRGGKGKRLPFNQAFLSSPAVTPRRDVKARQTELFQMVQKAANCSSLACLRSVPEKTLVATNDVLINQMEAQGGGAVLGPVIGFGPAPDGKHVPDITTALLRKGQVHREVKRVLLGTMANEGMGASADKGMPDYFPVLVRQILPSASDEVVARIQAGYSWQDPAQLAWDWTTDTVYACNAYNLAKAMPQTLRYVMSTTPATHGQDLSAYFYVDQATTPVADPALSREFQTRLLDFVHGREVDWPLYGARQRIYNITEAFETAELPARLRKRCDVLNGALLDPGNGA